MWVHYLLVARIWSFEESKSGGGFHARWRWGGWRAIKLIFLIRRDYSDRLSLRNT
jgi:hypothetical protein